MDYGNIDEIRVLDAVSPVQIPLWTMVTALNIQQVSSFPFRFSMDYGLRYNLR